MPKLCSKAVAIAFVNDSVSDCGNAVVDINTNSIRIIFFIVDTFV
jgi:hypothetical protein